VHSFKQSDPGATLSQRRMLRLIGRFSWKMTRRGKSPLAMESIDDRYRRSPRGVVASARATRGAVVGRL
jgi:hypothetical protein